MIRRMGSEATILRETIGAENGFGKKARSWSTVATEDVVVDVSGGSAMERLNLSEGIGYQLQPVLYFSSGTDVRENDRVRVDGILYDMDEPVVLPTHTVASATQVYESD